MSEAQLRAALSSAFNLGQTYWQQADSESYAANKRADATAAKFAALVEQTIAAASMQAEKVEQLRTALAWAIKTIDAEICTHEETHRGGAIWTICDGCGLKWADDRGGFTPYSEPPELTAARAALNATKPGAAS